MQEVATRGAEPIHVSTPKPIDEHELQTAHIVHEP
jgi:hypothetical protein